MPKFHPTYRSESLSKANSRNVCFAKSVGTIFIKKFSPNQTTKVFLGGDYIIPVGWDEILSCFAGIPAVL